MSPPKNVFHRHDPSMSDTYFGVYNEEQSLINKEKRQESINKAEKMLKEFEEEFQKTIFDNESPSKASVADCPYFPAPNPYTNENEETVPCFGTIEASEAQENTEVEVYNEIKDEEFPITERTFEASCVTQHQESFYPNDIPNNDSLLIGTDKAESTSQAVDIKDNEILMTERR